MAGEATDVAVLLDLRSVMLVSVLLGVLISGALFAARSYAQGEARVSVTVWALGMLSLSVLRAANALLIPAPPNNIDFASTAHFLKMMESTLAELARHGGAREYSFVKILTSKMNDQKSAHQAIKRMMDAVFPQDMLNAALKDSAEIDNATANLMTVYELTGPATRTETHKRCRAYLDAVGREVELLIRKTWPSHHRQLRKEGLL